jgi:membrane protein
MINPRWRNLFWAWWEQHDNATRALPRYVWKATQNYMRTGSKQAAALAYYAIFSIFPLALLLAVAVGGIVGPQEAQEQMRNGLTLFLPEATVESIVDALDVALGETSNFGLVALVAIIWAATGLFSNITTSLDTIFEVPAMRSLWRVRLLALLMGLTLVVLVAASFITSGVLRLLLALSLEVNIWISIGTFFLPLGLDIVIFALLFRYVPARHVQWDAVWPAAMFGAVGWELAKRGFEWYLANLASYSLIYGGIATGIVLLFWAYLIASLFLFSAELCARLNEWLIEQQDIAAAETELRRMAQHMETTLQNPAQALPPPEDMLLVEGKRVER